MFSGKAKIVLVEDDKVTLTVLNSIVSAFDAQIISFSSAQPALDFIRENDDVKVLVTDINMPEMSGDVLVREVLELKPWIDSYVVTSTTKMNNAIPTYMSGAREIFLKPINKATLNPFIEESLNRHKRWTSFLKQIKQEQK